MPVTHAQAPAAEVQGPDAAHGGEGRLDVCAADPAAQ
jgi:hypothetical protein